MSVNASFFSLIPAGATHTVVEERPHRGIPVFAVVAIIPDGASVPLNGYSSRTIAESTSEECNAHLSAARAEPIGPGDTATVDVDGEKITGTVYSVRDNGWPCVETSSKRVASGPLSIV